MSSFDETYNAEWLAENESRPNDTEQPFDVWCRAEANKRQREFRAAQKKFPRQFGDRYGSWEAEIAANSRDDLRMAADIYKKWKKAQQ